jgi:hypothetical protein
LTTVLNSQPFGSRLHVATTGDMATPTNRSINMWSHSSLGAAVGALGPWDPGQRSSSSDTYCLMILVHSVSIPKGKFRQVQPTAGFFVYLLWFILFSIIISICVHIIQLKY